MKIILDKNDIITHRKNVDESELSISDFRLDLRLFETAEYVAYKNGKFKKVLKNRFDDNLVWYVRKKKMK